MPADASVSTSSDAPLPAPARAARLVVERLAGVTVVGWAFDPAAPGQERLTLVCGQQRFTPVARRLPRADVSRAIGVEGIALGFEFELPLEAWQALAEPGAALGVALADAPAVLPAWRPDAAGLRAWMAGLAQSADLVHAQAALAILQPHYEQAQRWA
ncbi:MAG TPA: hypothetical protein VGQ91_01780, partial [Ideonella sp.]|nr:hypothetical protein [Ideonella sp.]